MSFCGPQYVAHARAYHRPVLARSELATPCVETVVPSYPSLLHQTTLRLLISRLWADIESAMLPASAVRTHLPVRYMCRMWALPSPPCLCRLVTRSAPSYL
jgi:hypothetical protein